MPGPSSTPPDTIESSFFFNVSRVFQPQGRQFNNKGRQDCTYRLPIEYRHLDQIGHCYYSFVGMLIYIKYVHKGIKDRIKLIFIILVA